MSGSLTILVLGGGPDRERDVSRASAAQVADALRQAGHQTIERDILPGDSSALDEKFDGVFPVLHGAFGEGGPLQEMLEQRGLLFVGCGSKAARAAMDKVVTKQVARRCDVLTPDWRILGPSDKLTLQLPVVIKPVNEGSSVDVFICHTQGDAVKARAELYVRHPRVLAESFVHGREMTVGIVEDCALPVIEIIPAASVTFYDYQAKYNRGDTRYSFDVPSALARTMQRQAMTLFRKLGCRHLARVDFMVDSSERAWMLEINTMPGFTTHSLLPMAARQSGVSMPVLCDRLVKLAMQTTMSR